MANEYARVLKTVIADTAKAQNTDLFAADFQMVRQDSTIRISIAGTAAVKVRLVPSTGTGFYLKAGVALVANSVHTEDVALDQGRTWNIQTDDGSGITVTHCVVQELSNIA